MAVIFLDEFPEELVHFHFLHHLLSDRGRVMLSPLFLKLLSGEPESILPLFLELLTVDVEDFVQTLNLQQICGPLRFFTSVKS